jgi:hypothetical protein
MEIEMVTERLGVFATPFKPLQNKPIPARRNVLISVAQNFIGYPVGGYHLLRRCQKDTLIFLLGSRFLVLQVRPVPLPPELKILKCLQLEKPRALLLLQPLYTLIPKKMVKKAQPQDARPSGPTLIQSTFLRKAAAVGIIILLYTAATPFSPIAWLTFENEGSFFLDRLLAGAFLFAAMYFQWRIAGQTYPVAICLPTGGRSIISNGNISRTSGDIVWLYQPSEYWKYLGTEAAMLALAEFSNAESLRRVLVSVVILALWAVGWFVTPERIKREGWEYLKKIWFWIALDEIMRVGTRGLGRRRRW